GRDRIRICEDTDGDGKADKFTVFAEGLSIPTTLAFHRGGVIVQNGTATLYLRDTDGDDRADVRKVLLTGWGAGDTHGGVSNFRYGLDNWYWAMQGYNNSTPMRPASDKHPAKEFATFRMGFFRFRLSNDDDPIVTDLEFIRSTNNNTWGLGFSEEGHIFGSTANGNPSEYMPIPNRYYEAVRGWSAPTLGGIAADNHFEPVTENVRQVDHHGGFTAACGHALYTARNYPQAYWNRTAFVCEPTGHLVATFVIEPHGAGFRSRYGWNLVASDDEWAAPIMAEVGPDGNVWVLDWYNYIVQHNPTPVGFQTGKGNAYETELRDKRHARVFRVVPKGWKENNASKDSNSRISLESVDIAALVRSLGNPNQLWRLHAQRLLIENGLGEGVGERLFELASASPKHPVNIGSVHAIRTFSELAARANRLTERLPPSRDTLTAEQDSFRKQFKELPTEVLKSMIGTVPRRLDRLRWLATNGLVVHHPNPQVQLAWLLAISEMPSSVDGARESLAAIGDPQISGDRILLDAATCAAARHDIDFLLLLATMPTDSRNKAGPSSGILDLVKRVAEHFARGMGSKTSLPLGEDARRAGEGDVGAGQGTETLATKNKGDAEQKSDAVDRSHDNLIRPSATFSRREKDFTDVRSVIVAMSKSESPYLSAIVEGLARGWPKDGRVVLDAETEAALVVLFKKLPREGQGRLVSLAERMGSKRMAEFGIEITSALLAEAADAKLDDAKRLAAARQAVEFCKSDEAVVVKVLNLLTPRTSPELAGGLLQALAASEVEAVGRLTVAKLGAVTPAARTAAVKLLLVRETWTPALLNALEKGTVGVAELSLDQKQALASHPNNVLRNRAKKLLAAGGGLPNPDRQRVLDELHPLTERKGDVAAGKLVFTKNCAKCHMHSGEGQKIGPDLTGMAVHPKHELLVHLIDPNRSVEGNFRVYTVVTDDGLVLTGLLAGESKTAIELVDSEAKRHVVQRDNIDELTATAKSLMPEGFEKQVTPDELTNLLEFLTARGKFFALDLRKAATAVSVRGMFYSEDSTVERLVFPDWSSKTFAGV
ncbi:MAG: c-type cytochrome, partial [Planctomycetales bacterium]|nr:c-type cytochrome [Planctomycetales bacterium]